MEIKFQAGIQKRTSKSRNKKRERYVIEIPANVVSKHYNKIMEIRERKKKVEVIIKCQ